MTLQEPIFPQHTDPKIHDTEIFAVPTPTPVFVDTTGRRRRVLRRLTYAFGGLCMLYAGLVCVSLAGGPVSSRAILPFPELAEHAVADSATPPTPNPPMPTPAPALTTPPAARIIDWTAARHRSASAGSPQRSGPVRVHPRKPSTKPSGPTLESTRTAGATPSPTQGPPADGSGNDPSSEPHSASPAPVAAANDRAAKFIPARPAVHLLRRALETNA